MRKPRIVEVQWSSPTRIWTPAIHKISAWGPPSKAGAPLTPLSLQAELQLNLGNLILNMFYHLSGSFFITAPWLANKLYPHPQDTVSSNLRVLTLCFWMLQETRSAAQAAKRLFLQTDGFQSNKKQTSLAFHASYRGPSFLYHIRLFCLLHEKAFQRGNIAAAFTRLHGLIWENSQVHTAMAIFLSPLLLGWLGSQGMLGEATGSGGWRERNFQQMWGEEYGKSWQCHCKLLCDSLITSRATGTLRHRPFKVAGRTCKYGLETKPLVSWKLKYHLTV